MLFLNIGHSCSKQNWDPCLQLPKLPPSMADSMAYTAYILSSNQVNQTKLSLLIGVSKHRVCKRQLLLVSFQTSHRFARLKGLARHPGQVRTLQGRLPRPGEKPPEGSVWGPWGKPSVKSIEKLASTCATGWVRRKPFGLHSC